MFTSREQVNHTHADSIPKIITELLTKQKLPRQLQGYWRAYLAAKRVFQVSEDLLDQTVLVTAVKAY